MQQGAGESRAPVRFRRRLAVDLIVADDLAAESAAVVVSSYGRTLVLVNIRVHKHLRAAVARHAVEAHMDGCRWPDCARAGSWLSGLRERVVHTVPA